MNMLFILQYWANFAKILLILGKSRTKDKLHDVMRDKIMIQFFKLKIWNI